jgi:Fucose permease
MATAQSKKPDRYHAAVVMTLAMLALWGFAHRLYATLLPSLAGAMALSSNQTDVARAALAIGYFLMALPAAFISRNFGYKIGALCGLGIFAIGMFLFYPAVSGHSFAFIIVAASVIGSGLAVVQVTTTPLIVFLGRRQTAIARLTFAQGLAPVGGILGLLLGRKILSEETAHGVFSAGSLVLPISFIGVAAIALAFIVEMVNFPPVAAPDTDRSRSTLASFLPPLKIAHFRYGLAALFLSLLAQAALAGYSDRYMAEALPAISAQNLDRVSLAQFLAFGAGRLFGPLVMLILEPMSVVVGFAVLSTVCMAVAVAVPGTPGVAAVIAAAFFLSIQFPAILAHAIRDLGEMAKSGTALMMCYAFSGTAICSVAALICHPASARPIMGLVTIALAGVSIITIILRRGELGKVQARAYGVLCETETQGASSGGT